MKKTDKIVILDEYKSNVEQDRSEKQAISRPRYRFRLKKWKLLKCGGVVILFFLLLYLLGGLPFFRIAVIDVEGNQALSDEKVVTLSGIHIGDNFFYADVRTAKKSLQQNPFVKTVSIQRKLPNRFVICLEERRAVGYLVTTDGYVQVDEDGRFLAIQQSLSNYNLPVISGVELSELPSIGGFIENAKLKQALEVLQYCDQSLLSNISELNVGQDYYILAYTNQKVEVRLGGLDNIEQRLQDLNQILTSVVGVTIAADQILYIDMRYDGQQIIKPR